MPQETHNFLIQYETVGSEAVVAAGRRIAESQTVLRDSLTTTRTQFYGFDDATTTATGGFRAIAAGMDETGKAAQRSGHWLGRYIQRYLVRYLVVWQGMIALRTGIRDWTQAHEDLDRALFRLQTTMGMTTDQAQRYMSTMRQMGGIAGVPAAQMAGGAMQLGEAGAGMAGQFGAMTGMGGGEAMQFFAGIQRQYELTNAQIEQLIPRMFAAFARSGQEIQPFLKDWEEMLSQFDAGSAAIGEWTRAWGLYESTGMRATDRVSAAWTDLMATIGDTQPITDAKNAIADWFDRLTGKILWGEATATEQQEAANRYYAETGKQPPRFEQLTGGLDEFWAWVARGGLAGNGGTATRRTEGRLTIPPSDIGTGMQFGIQGFGGRMTAPEAERYEDLIQKWDAYFLEQGRYLEKQTMTLVTEIGQPLREITGSAEASKMALEEMNERQKAAVYNWPAGAAGVEIGRGAIGDVELREPAGGAGGWQPQTIDWNNPWVIPPQIRVSGSGGAGGAGATPPLHMTLKTQIDLDGKKVGEGTSQVLGDMYSQASKATYGSGGGLVSAF